MLLGINLSCYLLVINKLDHNTLISIGPKVNITLLNTPRNTSSIWSKMLGTTPFDMWVLHGRLEGSSIKQKQNKTCFTLERAIPGINNCNEARPKSRNGFVQHQCDYNYSEAK